MKAPGYEDNDVKDTGNCLYFVQHPKRALLDPSPATLLSCPSLPWGFRRTDGFADISGLVETMVTLPMTDCPLA